jgi:hypothetical protein
VLVGTRGPLAMPWQVAMPSDQLPFLLLGWRVAAELERDGGMPASVGGLLTDALLRVGVLSYPSSSEPLSTTATQVRLMTGGARGERIRSLLSPTPSRIWLVSATSSSVACQLFDDPGFPWWMQGQIVLISAAEPSAALNRLTLLKLMNPMQPMRGADLRALSLKAVVQPGVDGDVAAIMSADTETDAAIVAAIESSARDAGFQWRTVPEAEFARVLSDESPVAPDTA